MGWSYCVCVFQMPRYRRHNYALGLNNQRRVEMVIDLVY